MNYLYTNIKKIILGALVLFFLLSVGITAYGEEKTNASLAQEDRYYRTVTRTKKGIQEAFSYSGVYKDLGISHTLVNVCLNQLINGNTKHIYNGKTYYFNYIPDLPIKNAMEFNDNNVSITVVLLMQMDYRSINNGLIYNTSSASHKYYGWNVYNESGMELIRALMDFLASRYGREECHIDNWIVGNEVNMPNAWNYTGTTNLDINVDIAARSFKIVNDAIKKYNKGAKAYISLDHSWTHNDEGRGIAGKSFIDAFAAKINAIEPGIDWNIAYHPYAPIMTESNIWNSRNANYYTTKEVGTDFISAKNLEILTEYIKANYGEKVRIILSEQGFTAYNGQEARQAAALAYTYYVAEFNDMVDATMFRSMYDAGPEMEHGFYFGMLNSNGSKRAAYDVFKYMDTAYWEEYTKPCLNTMGISIWNEYITYFDSEKFVPKPLEEIRLKKTGTVIGVGHSEAIEFTTYPEFADMTGVIWTSQDENIATVDPNTGEIKGVSQGRTIVNVGSNEENTVNCIVVIKSEEEIKENIEKFLSKAYYAAWSKEISKEDIESYVIRLLSHNMSAVQIVYEMITGSEAMNPSENNREYVKKVYDVILDIKENEIDSKTLLMYENALDAGADKNKIIAELVGKTEFDYRCYAHDVTTGLSKDVYALRDIDVAVYNRNLSVTAMVGNAYNVIFNRIPKLTELAYYCEEIIGGRLDKKELIDKLIKTEEYASFEDSNETFLDKIYMMSELERVNIYARRMWLGLLESGTITREEFIYNII